MLVHATVEKMTAMHLTAMAEAFQRQLTSAQFADLSFEDRIGLLIDHEWTAREQRKLQRRLQVANTSTSGQKLVPRSLRFGFPVPPTLMTVRRGTPGNASSRAASSAAWTAGCRSLCSSPYDAARGIRVSVSRIARATMPDP